MNSIALEEFLFYQSWNSSLNIRKSFFEKNKRIALESVIIYRSKRELGFNVVDVDINGKLVDTNNPANFSKCNKLEEEYRDKLPLVANDSNVAKFYGQSAVVSPASVINELVFGMMTTDSNGAKHIVPSDVTYESGRLNFEFTPLTGATVSGKEARYIYTPVYGFDDNNNGTLDDGEEKEINIKDDVKVLGITKTAYQESVEEIRGWHDSWYGEYAVGGELIHSFFGEFPPDRVDLTNSVYQLGYFENPHTGDDKTLRQRIENQLGHGAGTSFNEAHTAFPPSIIYSKDSDVARMVGEETHNVKSSISTLMGQSKFRNAFSSKIQVNETTGSFDISYTEVGLVYSRAASPIRADEEMFRGFLRCVCDYNLRVTYNKLINGNYSINIEVVDGLLYDMYDFLYGKIDTIAGFFPTDYNTDGVTMSLGWNGSSRKVGGIFVVFVQFEVESYVFHNYSL